MAASKTTAADLLARRQRLLGPAYRLFYDEPVHIVRGEGAWLFDANDRRYLDLYNNVPHVGHSHPAVVAAICRQAGMLNTHTRYLHEGVLDYAARLTGLLPAGLDTAMFSCTGTEANELALRVARAATGREGVIVTEFAYHGNSTTIAAISTEDTPMDRRPGWVAAIPFPDAYRGEHRGKDAGLRYAEGIDAAVAELAGRGIRPAAFIVDTISSSSGVVEPPAGFLDEAARRARAAGALVIADEVQPGFGRTGRHFWGFDSDAVVPDIVTLGKPIGNGHPLAATVVRRELADAFAARDSYFNTFGGNPVSAAAGMAVLDVLERESLQQNAVQVGARLRAGLEALAARHEIIGDVRGHGLFIAVDLVSDRDSRTPAGEAADRIVNALRRRRVLTNTIGPYDNVLKLRPPMVLTAEQADMFLTEFEQVLQHDPGS
ncbi:MAG: aminotransferase class III-fold pyridoxal phosphate-dependent enzyme [Woeseiaceae bacterium]|nr:aminotransferase class III-fold pyridoxal phosphate-dependent enzyme [Woeseiaceae bacterium]